MLARLDAATRDHHAEVDGYWLDLMAQGVTSEQYSSQLVRVYGFEAPLESALAYTPGFVVADRRDLTRSGLIVQDLIALGMKAAAASRLPQSEIAPFANAQEALGWWYVSERQSQLYNAVKRHLIARVPQLANACAFLGSYDGVAAARWQQLGSVLDAQSWKYGEDVMISAARNAFAHALDWFRGTQPLARGA
ncbi:MAG: biliverdin-producing heme oxygenase [Deltaproteobacteria bacterium]|nr:biliverdin-producing heme oxygenase [Deltaproteobacteria bacterium]